MPNGKGETNQGDDISGTIHELGEGVSEFEKGDRVIAFHGQSTNQPTNQPATPFSNSTTTKLPQLTPSQK